MKSSRSSILARAANGFPLGKTTGTEQVLFSCSRLDCGWDHSFRKEPNDVNKLMRSAKAIEFGSS